MSKVDDFAMLAAEALWESLPSIDQCAGECGQHEQSEEAEKAHWQDGVAICLEPIIHKLVLECAKVCDMRAGNRTDNIAVWNEATKCGHSIRHNLICDDAETICLTCDGEGCDKCNGSGVRESAFLKAMRR